MKKISVLALVGGISESSMNRKLYESFSSIDLDLDFKVAPIQNLPFFNQDLEMDPPAVVFALKKQIRESDAVLFVTPEYNRSIPGVLKNAIDWGSRPMGQNSWENIPAAIMGTSMSRLGTYSAQLHLRTILDYLRMKVMPHPEYCETVASRSVNPEQYFLDDKVRHRTEHFLNAFKDWIEFIGEKETNFMKVKLSLFSYSQEA